MLKLLACVVVQHDGKYRNFQIHANMQNIKFLLENVFRDITNGITKGHIKFSHLFLHVHCSLADLY